MEDEMRPQVVLAALTIVALATNGALAMNPDDELWIPAAARGAGSGGSFWMTDLTVFNPGEEDLTVEIAWLERFADNGEVEGIELDIAAGETLVLEDVVNTLFGLDEAAGAIHIEVVEEEQGVRLKAVEDEDEAAIVATARIYNLDDDETFGQGFEGLTSGAAISAGDEDPTHAIGMADGSAFRSNWFGLNITTDEDDEPDEAEVLVEVLDEAGDVVAAESFEMAPMAPLLHRVADLGPGSSGGVTLRFTMLEGEGLFGASMVDQASNDPTTLETHWGCDGEQDEEIFTDRFFLDDCTFTTTGRNAFWIPLVVGYEAEFEGEEDGEVIGLVITVLDETYVVDGVETRVVQEYETADDEIVEISRNYVALCEETGSIVYFGEDVDIYENGQVVSHDGAWLAGIDGAEPGILMPGTVLLGSRYMQEIAPDVALDRVEHLSMDETVETEAGTFEGCLLVEETTPFEPGHISLKLYAPGVGLVVDDILELVSVDDPSSP
jgi:hypothetical protein